MDLIQCHMFSAHPEVEEGVELTMAAKGILWTELGDLLLDSNRFDLES